MVAAVTGFLAAVAIFPIAPASASEPSITFDGAGWGHGVGMSQYGTLARANDGQSSEQILLAYYGDPADPNLTRITTIGDPGLDDPGPVFTNVGSDTTSTTLRIENGPAPGDGVTIVRGPDSAPSPPTAHLTTGDTVVITDTTPEHGQPNGCTIELRIGGETTMWESGSCDISIELTNGSAEPTNLVSVSGGCRRLSDCTFGYGTFHTVDNGSPQRTNTDRFGGCQGCPVWMGYDLVVESGLDDYTRGIAEMPFSWPSEALEVQAIAARSYAASFAVIDGSGDHRSKGCFCDVRNSSSSQVYAGWLPDSSYATMADRWDQAAAATNGQVLTHPSAPDLGIVRAYYSSSNGGASEWVKEKWGSDLPYLLSVDDPWSLEPPNPLRSWSETVSADTVVDEVWGTSSPYVLTGAAVTERNTSGSARTIRFEAVTPANDFVTKDVPVATVTSRFGLDSWYFDIDAGGLVPPVPKGSDTVAVQDPATGIWTLRDGAGGTEAFYFGNPLDIPFIGDWNGDGIDTAGLYRESTGFLFLRNSNTQGIADVDIYYGNPGDLPVAGDWNGDGTDTVGIYRRSDNTFYLRNSNTQGIADIVIPLGDAGDVPLAGDWDGDGVDTIGVYRPSNKTLYFVNDLGDPIVDVTHVYAGTSSADEVVVGDWDGDGIDTVGVFRTSTAHWYLRDTFEQAAANIVFEFGTGGMNPVAGYWGD